MSTAVIIAIVVVVVVAIALIALPRMRAQARERERERELVRRRGEVAEAHRDSASERAARAEEAEQIAARERAEAELHETRAKLHERGLADDELDLERDRQNDGETRFEREERDSTIPPDERPAPR
jgi:uncharacterized membrane protein YcjF (UPF0283 family)